MIPVCEDEFARPNDDAHEKETMSNEDKMDTENGESKNIVAPKNSTTSNFNQIESMRTQINHVLLGQQMTCEILTNLCCDSGNDSESWEDDTDDMNLSDMVRNRQKNNRNNRVISYRVQSPYMINPE